MKPLSAQTLLLSLLLAQATLTNTTSAQMAAEPGGAQPAGVFSDDVEGALKSLTSALKLSAEQQAKARVILEERQVQILAVRKEFPAPKPGADPAPGGPDKMRKVMQAAHARMLEILDANQGKQYDALDTTGRAPSPQ